MHPALEAMDLIVFDLDGTLIDSAPDLAIAVDTTLAKYDAPPAGVAKVRDWVGNGTHKLVERALADAGLDTADVGAAHTFFLARYHDAPCERSQLFDGARECLHALQARRLTQMLITNKPVSFLPAILEKLGIEQFFALTLGGDSLAEKKPHPAPLLHAAEHAGATPTRCLMIGDSKHDIAAGQAAGFRTLAVTYGYNHGEPIADSQPDFLVESLAELTGDAARPQN